MKEGNNNLMNDIERLSRLVAYVKTMNGQVSIIERDLLLQELREMYMEVLTWDLSKTEDTSTIEKEPQEVVTFENIMQHVTSVEEPQATSSEMVEQEKVEERKPEVVMEEKVEVKEVKQEEGAEQQIDAVAEAKIAEAIAEFKEEPKVEEAPQEVEEESPFAPAEPEEEVVPAPEPIMESIEGNQYEEIFEEKPIEEAQPIIESTPKPTVEVKPAPVEEKKPKSVETKVEQPTVKVVEERVAPIEQSKPVQEHKVEKVATPKVEHKHMAQSAQPSLFDYLSTVATTKEQPTASTLAEKLGGNHATLETQLEQKVHSQKVDDLRKVININDKFSFMTELFHSNMKAYNDFILELNKLSNKSDAMKYVEEVGEQYEWDSNSLAVKTFYKVMERKF